MFLFLSLKAFILKYWWQQFPLENMLVFMFIRQNWEVRAEVLLWAKIQLCCVFNFCWTYSVFKIFETWARSLKFNSDFRLLRLYKFNWLALVYAHSKILVNVKEWTFEESQSEHRNVISRVKGLTLWCLSAAADGKSLQSCHAISTFFFFFWKPRFTNFHSFFPLCLIIKELQKAIDNRKAIILSINLCSSEFTQSDSEESKKLQERLTQMNVRWEHVCSMIEEWRSSLQDALIQCQVGAVPLPHRQHPTFWKYEPFSYLLCSQFVWSLPVKTSIELWHVFFSRMHLHYLKHVFTTQYLQNLSSLE